MHSNIFIAFFSYVLKKQSRFATDNLAYFCKNARFDVFPNLRSSDKMKCREILSLFLIFRHFDEILF